MTNVFLEILVSTIVAFFVMRPIVGAIMRTLTKTA
jgi:hypothetical protein